MLLMRNIIFKSPDLKVHFTQLGRGERAWDAAVWTANLVGFGLEGGRFGSGFQGLGSGPAGDQKSELMRFLQPPVDLAGRLPAEARLCRGWMIADPAQFETFLRQYQDMVYATAFRLLGREAEAEDMAQETFVRAWNHWDELAGSPSAGGWLKTVARNLCLNHLERYRNRWKFFSELKSGDADDDDEGLAATFAAPETLATEVLTGDQRGILEEALSKLPNDQRLALVLYHYEDLDYGEIAVQLKVSLGKVKTDIHRARVALQKKLQPRRAELGV